MTIYHKDKTLQNRFKECRLNANLSQRSLSNLLGLSSNGTAIRYYEQKKRIPNIPILIKMSNILNVSIDYLLCLDDWKSHAHYTQEVLGLDDELIALLHLATLNNYKNTIINDYILKLFVYIEYNP